MHSMRVLKATALGAVLMVAISITGSTTVAAQQGHAYGLGRPATVSELPAGPFRSALEALPGRARGRAMAVLQGGQFTQGDLPYLRVARRALVTTRCTTTWRGIARSSAKTTLTRANWPASSTA